MASCPTTSSSWPRGRRTPTSATTSGRSTRPGLKTLDDAFELRRRVLLAFEQAERETDAEKRRQWLTFVVIGGGPTGVEMAGALVEIARHTLTREFRRIDPRAARVILVEAGPRILTAYPEDLSRKAVVQLEGLGVQVWTGAPVTGIDDRECPSAATDLMARTVVWAAGVQASPLGGALGAPLDRAGRVKVTPELTLPGRPEVFVIGDLAALEQDGRPVPGRGARGDADGPARRGERRTRGSGRGSRSRSATTTRGRSPPSAGAPASRGSEAGASSRASWPGSPGSGSTSSSSSASATGSW